MTAELIYTIRGALMALPSRVAINAAALSDPAEVAEYMRGEVNQIAEEIALFRYDPAKYEARVRERRSWTDRPPECSGGEAGGSYSPAAQRDGQRVGSTKPRPVPGSIC